MLSLRWPPPGLYSFWEAALRGPSAVRCITAGTSSVHCRSSCTAEKVGPILTSFSCLVDQAWALHASGTFTVAGSGECTVAVH